VAKETEKTEAASDAGMVPVDKIRAMQTQASRDNWTALAVRIAPVFADVTVTERIAVIARATDNLIAEAAKRFPETK
jgi:hypothetical protein